MPCLPDAHLDDGYPRPVSAVNDHDDGISMLVILDPGGPHVGLTTQVPDLRDHVTVKERVVPGQKHMQKCIGNRTPVKLLLSTVQAHLKFQIFVSDLLHVAAQGRIGADCLAQV